MSTRATRPSVVATARGIVVLAALLAGCGADPSVEEFCDTSEISAIQDNDDPGYLTKVTETMSDSEAPDEIADDWEIYLSGLAAFAAAVEDADPSSTGDDDAYVDARKTMLSDEFTEATARVEAFFIEHCDP